MCVKELINLYNVKPYGVLHVGAHFAEENEEYRINNFDNGGGIIWVEAIPKIADVIKKKLDPNTNKIYCAAVWNYDGIEMELNVTSKTASSSLLSLGEHLSTYPEIYVEEKVLVKTARLDTLLKNDDNYELLVLDIQGAEDRAIEGIGVKISNVNYIFMEVSKRELYIGTKLVYDMDKFLSQLGFKRVFTAWDRRAKWGDALYIRNEIFNQTLNQRFHSKRKAFQRQIRQWIPLQFFPLLVKIKKLQN